ncbi:LppU/SCO3897 family protein [Streptomyces sp. 3211]|uniref:LppU/SCO3897 family protein n=1 Tax=Streptomyces sp. 3211 TaxID=1964449 RepID=UPI003FA6C72A
MLAIGLGVLALAVWASRDQANLAKVGNCLTNKGTAASPDLVIVDCEATPAEFRVLKVVPDTSATSACNGVAGMKQVYAYQSKAKQVVLCLGPAK